MEEIVEELAGTVNEGLVQSLANVTIGPAVPATIVDAPSEFFETTRELRRIESRNVWSTLDTLRKTTLSE